jgi:hypothetical protein
MTFQQRRHAPARSEAGSVLVERQPAARLLEALPGEPCYDDCSHKLPGEEKSDDAPMQVFLGKISPYNVLRTSGGRAVVPYTHEVTLPYVELYSISSPSTGNLISGKVFNMLSAYDPNYSDAGHQPLGFDEWTRFYNEYFVKSVDWEVEFSSLSTAYPLLGNAMNHSSLSLIGSQANTYLEQPGAQSVILRQSDAGPRARLTGRFDTAKWFGCKSSELRVLDDIRAGNAASPTEAVGLHIGIGTFDTHAAQTVYVKVKLHMRVCFLKPIQLAGS